jgi:hypothetical protein
VTEPTLISIGVEKLTNGILLSTLTLKKDLPAIELFFPAG